MYAVLAVGVEHRAEERGKHTQIMSKNWLIIPAIDLDASYTKLS